MNINEFTQCRYGMFIHFGLYSHLGRGEWVMNRESITPDRYKHFATEFNPHAFDANEIADIAVAAGMKYIVFTTMHHEGFRMYDTALSDFSSVKLYNRDFVREIIDAARSRNLHIGLYHSLNNWFDQPDAVMALENKAAYETFITNTHRRIEELVTHYSPIDILWYDGWWPFNADEWQAKQMNEMARRIQPHVLFNGRNGLPGDFATPEQHLTPPTPWRPWEACLTVNDNWGFHQGDDNWKSSTEIIKSLVRVAQGRGNLLLNIGLDGSGKIPEECKKRLLQVGKWLEQNKEAVFGQETWTVNPYQRGEDRGDWSHHGLYTANGCDLYLIGTSLPSKTLVLTGLEGEVKTVNEIGGENLSFTQTNDKITVDLPSHNEPLYGPRVIKFHCDRSVRIYKTGGMQTPQCPHPRYDPVQSDISW